MYSWETESHPSISENQRKQTQVKELNEHTVNGQTSGSAHILSNLSLHSVADIELHLQLKETAHFVPSLPP